MAFVLLLGATVGAQTPARLDSLILHVSDDSARQVRALIEVRSSAGHDSLRVWTSENGRAALPTAGGTVVQLRVRAFGHESRLIRIALDSVRGPVSVILPRRDDLLGLVCTGQVFPGIVLVFDSAHRTDSARADVRVRDGAYADTLSFRLSRWEQQPGFAFERPGRYSIEVRAAGFRPWRQDSLVVKKSGCFVRTESLHVRLERLP